MNLGAYNKTITALVTGLIGWAAVVVTSARGSISSSEWLGLAVAVATALGVYAVPNGPTAVQVVNDPADPVPVEVEPERGAIDPGSLVLGFLIALAFVVLIATLDGYRT